MNLVLMNVDEDYTVMVRVPHNYTVMVHAPAEPQPADGRCFTFVEVVHFEARSTIEATSSGGSK